MLLLGLPFKAVAPNYHEVHHAHLTPEQLVKFLAVGKAEAAAKKYRNAIIIGSDTIVSFRGTIFGKPKDRKDAVRILKTLNGQVHHVYTGVAVINMATGKKIIRAIKSRVYFRKLSEQGIKNYVATGEPMDKAGGYAMHGIGAGLIKKVIGSYTGVVGLPMDELERMVKKVL